MQFGELAKANPAVAIGRLSVFRSAARGQHECDAARPRCTESSRKPNAKSRNQVSR